MMVIVYFYLKERERDIKVQVDNVSKLLSSYLRALLYFYLLNKESDST